MCFFLSSLFSAGLDCVAVAAFWLTDAAAVASVLQLIDVFSLFSIALLIL
jgi:hypothetical protein